MKQHLIIASVICLQVCGWAQFPALWIGTYGDMVKDYQIKKDQADTLHTDENNGILISKTFLDGCFYECYEVNGMPFHSTMRLQEKDVFYELIGTPYKSGVSRNIGDEKEGSHDVRSYLPGVIRKVLLIKN